jgi:hypothetical protein
MSRADIQDIDKSDIYSYESLLTDEERRLLHAVRKFMASAGEDAVTCSTA